MKSASFCVLLRMHYRCCTLLFHTPADTSGGFSPSQRRSKAWVLQPEILPLSVHEERMETGKNCFCGHRCVCLVLVSICLCHLDCLGRVSGNVIQRAWVILKYKYDQYCHPQEADLPFERVLNTYYIRGDIAFFIGSLWIKPEKGLFVHVF